MSAVGDAAPGGRLTLSFGTEQDGDVGSLAVDLDRLLRSRMLVQAASGGGKSYLARALLEGTTGRVQQFVLDPEGEFVTLRERFPFVLASAGEEGDVPARPENAAALCRGLMGMGVSAVVDLSDLGLAERRRFVRLFLEELMALGKDLWRPLLVVLDEAHRYAPERGAGESEATDAVITLASQGRKRGYALCALTQRLSKLHKDAAAELLNVFVGMTQLDVDVGRAADALGFEKRRKGQLRDLDHEFFAHGPALPSREPVRVRAGRIFTSHPEPGGLTGSLAPAPPPPEEIRAVLEELARSVEPAGVADGVPEETRRGAAHDVLRRDFEREVRREAERRLEGRLAEEVERVAGPLRAKVEALETTVKKARRAAGEAVRALEEAPQDAPLPDLPSADESAEKSLLERPPTSPQDADEGGAARRSVRDGHAEGLPPQRRRILGALREMLSLGIASLPRQNLAVFAGQGPRSSAFRDHVAALKEAGLVGYPSAGRVALTEDGLASVEDSPTRTGKPRGLRELHEVWISRLPDASGRVVSALVEAHPLDLSREALAGAAGQSRRSSAFRDRVAELKALGLVEYPGKGKVRASSLLFPEHLKYVG